MSPKEKAKELVDKYCKGIFSGEYMPTEWSIICSRQCALIAVGEIINSYSGNLENGTIDFMINPNPIEYWNEVKEELNKK